MVTKFNPEVNTVFLDCDGVLADFDTLAWEIFGEDPREFENKHGSDAFWGELDWWYGDDNKSFFESLELMPDARELHDALKHLNPPILTGAPKQIPHSHIQKQIWGREKFGEEQAIITCLSKYKRTFCKPGDIIIDDWPKHRKLWEDAGGIWVHHYNTNETLKVLKTLGVID